MTLLQMTASVILATATSTTPRPTQALPTIIQGGMGVAVSSWQLARAVSKAGQLGVVSGTALDTVIARRLQDGDASGHVRRALAHFPVPALADRVLRRYFRAGGRRSGIPYLPIAKVSQHPLVKSLELSVVANFVEVWLAKEGHEGLVGINFLEKVQLATPSAAYGAMLAGVDYVLMGAGIPAEIPALLTGLARHETRALDLHVENSTTRYSVEFDPEALTGGGLPPLHRPRFLAIVAAHVLAVYLTREESTRPDGFIIEGPRAGGHNAPPRGRGSLDDDGQPVYGPRDDADLAKVAAVGLPFWVAGGYGTPERVKEALAIGAAGVQVGTLFALAAESGLDDTLREQLLRQIDSQELEIRTDPLASSTGFPFKVATLPGTLSDATLYEERPRLCDLGYLRVPYERSPGVLGYRCPAEPVATFVRKGGSSAEAAGRKCLCNALTANVGLSQTRRDGYEELPLVTLGTDLDGVTALRAAYPQGWAATEAVAYLESKSRWQPTD
ncbi:nitronate monooxygenase [Cryobacterium sp. M15]|uniref:nitronate monooxygenase n=1 Tax=Cryobacterium sp. M15 TaxID=2048291 RepID=UPI001E5E1857|nr:nitronate monooxygenase [Cryobacterium sp. M15]